MVSAIPSQDWERWKKLILHLYITKGYQLKRVQEKLEKKGIYAELLFPPPAQSKADGSMVVSSSTEPGSRNGRCTSRRKKAAAGAMMATPSWLKRSTENGTNRGLRKRCHILGVSHASRCRPM